jgi:methylaspartate mutase epsilon subunit
MARKVTNAKIDEDEFLKMREPVLALWPTGKEVDLDEALEYQRNLPDSKNMLKIIQKLHAEGKAAIFPRAGTALVEDQISLYRKLVDSGALFLPVTTDSYTRQLEFKKVESALEETRRTGRKVLNGYPLINHGVKQTRRIVESVDRGAFNPRMSLKAHQLGAEIALASGMTGIPGGPFISYGAYEKNVTIEEAIAIDQYLHRLIGYYAERGVIITCDNHGWILTGIQPMTVNLATTIAEALMEAAQGVKSVVSIIHLMGNLAQDLAWIRVTPRLMREYLDKLGYKDVIVAGTVTNHTPLFPMPQRTGGAFAFANYTAMVSALGKVDGVHVRTIDEGVGIPSEEAHVSTYESATWLINVIRGQKIELELQEIDEEAHIAELEIRAILDKLLEVGDGDIVVGCIRGVEAGFIDSCFSPNKQVRDLVMGVKDSQGAIRYKDFGNLPLPEEVKEFHRRKLAEREQAEGRSLGYEAVVQDLWAFSKGELVGRR